MPKRAPEYLSARREEVLAGARRCFARFGFEGATVPRLEAEIGLSHGAIFNYFENKLELFLELAKREHERWDSIWRDSGFAGLARAIVDEDPDWLSVHLEFERRVRTDPALLARIRDELGTGDDEVAWIEREQAAGRMRDDVPARTIFNFLHLVLDGLALARISPGGELDVEPILSLVDAAVGGTTRSRQRLDRGR
jgi:TetR/AcrR family transcriptional regulator, transcriptional repressor of aconitase